MNIIVSLHEAGGRYCFRPDTTLEKESFDYYVPEGIMSMSCCPVLFVRICKAGKAIKERFAERYFDEGGYGVLLYAEDLIQGHGTCITQGAAGGGNTSMSAAECAMANGSFSMASSLDKTSLLPFPLYGKDVLGNSMFSMSVNGKMIFGIAPDGQKSLQSYLGSLPETLNGISSYTSLRTGDIVAMELSMRIQLWNAPFQSGHAANGRQDSNEVTENGATVLKGMLDGKEIFSINIR